MVRLSAEPWVEQLERRWLPTRSRNIAVVTPGHTTEASLDMSLPASARPARLKRDAAEFRERLSPANNTELAASSVLSATPHLVPVWLVWLIPVRVMPPFYPMRHAVRHSGKVICVLPGGTYTGSPAFKKTRPANHLSRKVRLPCAGCGSAGNCLQPVICRKRCIYSFSRNSSGISVASSRAPSAPAYSGSLIQVNVQDSNCLVASVR